MINEQPVLIKGAKGGLNIYVSNQFKMDDIKDAFLNKLQSAKPFFKGATVKLTFIGKEFSENERRDLLNISLDYMKLGSVEFIDHNIENGNEDQDMNNKEPVFNIDNAFDGVEEGLTKFIRGTVRSGQRISYEGNIVVVGDVNPGGELIAAGNILIFGTFRGTAHAGANGNTEAFVAAISLLPTQLRIAEYIARAGEDEVVKPDYPEICYVKDDSLIIEPFVPIKGR